MDTITFEGVSGSKQNLVGVFYVGHSFTNRTGLDES